MPDYAAMKRELPRLRSALTRAKNSGDPVQVLAAVEKAVDGFDRFGWPDAWSTWRIALDDAFYSFSRSDAYEDDTYDGGGEIAARFRAAADRFSW
jgi:hypothetical protein